MAFVHKSMNITPLTGSAYSHRHWQHRDNGPYATSVQVNMHGIGPVLVSFDYHRNGIMEELFGRLARLTKGGEIPFLAFGDYNKHADAVSQLHWVHTLQCTVVAPREATCSLTGSTIDYILVSNSILPFVVGIYVGWAVCWSPHAFLYVVFSKAPQLTQQLVPRIPKSLPPLPRPFPSPTSPITETGGEIG